MNFREKQWLRHLGYSREFPRVVAIGIQRKNMFARVEVIDEDDYVRTINNNKSNNVYTTLYSHRQIRESKYDKILIDVDSKSGIEGSHKLMQMVVSHVRKLYKIEPTTYCTAGKGFHVILHFPEIQVSRFTLRQWAKAFTSEAIFNNRDIKDMGLEGVEIGTLLIDQIDTSVFGDKMQVSRIPYTFNHSSHKNFRLCCPIVPEWSVERIRRELINPKSEVRFEQSIQIARELVNINLTMDVEVEERIQFKGDNKKCERELLYLFKNASRVKDGRRRILGFILIPRLVQIGEDLFGVKKFCREWLKMTGKDTDQYEMLIDNQYRRTVDGPDGDGSTPWYPWSLSKFKKRHPGIYAAMGIDEEEFFVEAVKYDEDDEDGE